MVAKGLALERDELREGWMSETERPREIERRREQDNKYEYLFLIS